MKIQSIHVSEIPKGAKIEEVKTKDSLYPEMSNHEFIISYKYKGRTIFWNLSEHRGVPSVIIKGLL